MTEMIVRATCSPSSDSFVKNKNASEFADEYPKAMDNIYRNHYVDDYLGCADTIEVSIQVIHIHNHGGFEMVGWVSSSQEVIETSVLTRNKNSI